MTARERGVVPLKVWYAIMISYLAGIIVAVATFIYARHIDNQSNQLWCEIVIASDDAYKQTPPVSEVGKKISESMHRLRSEFGC